MRKTTIKRSLTINGMNTSVALEPEFWKYLEEIADRTGTKYYNIINHIDLDREEDSNLASRIRLFVVDHYRGTTN